MKTFNDIQPGDYVEFEMRVKETTRAMLQSMFISSEENQVMLSKALDEAIKSLDLPGIMRQQAEISIKKSIEDYFKYGLGSQIINKSVDGALSKIFAPHFLSGTPTISRLIATGW